MIGMLVEVFYQQRVVRKLCISVPPSGECGLSGYNNKGNIYFNYVHLHTFIALY